MGQARQALLQMKEEIEADLRAINRLLGRDSQGGENVDRVESDIPLPKLQVNRPPQNLSVAVAAEHVMRDSGPTLTWEELSKKIRELGTQATDKSIKAIVGGFKRDGQKIFIIKHGKVTFSP